MAIINKRFLHIKSQAKFDNEFCTETDLDSNLYKSPLADQIFPGTVIANNAAVKGIRYYAIVFIQDSQLIWTHGKMYSCPYTKEELENLFLHDVKIGTVTSGTEAKVEIVENNTLNFVVPKGDKGDPGEKGEKGDKGDPGPTQIATSTSLGAIRLLSDAVCPNSTIQGILNSRAYAVQLTSGGQAVVLVPWINTTYTPATTTSNGLLSAADKLKIDNIENTIEARLEDYLEILPYNETSTSACYSSLAAALASVPSDKIYYVCYSGTNGAEIHGFLGGANSGFVAGKYNDNQGNARTDKIFSPLDGQYMVHITSTSKDLTEVKLGGVASSDTYGTVRLGSDIIYTGASNSITTTSSRTYAILRNSNGQLVVNVPWTNVNSSYASKTTSQTFSNTLTFSGLVVLRDIYGYATDTSNTTRINITNTSIFVYLNYNLSSLQVIIGNKSKPSNAGSTKFFVDGTAGGSYAWSTSSDMTLKNVVEGISLDVEDIANAPIFTYTLKGDESGTIMVGSSALYWKEVLPEIVNGEEGCYSLQYGNLGVVASVSLAREIKDLKKIVNDLLKEITILKAL